MDHETTTDTEVIDREGTNTGDETDAAAELTDELLIEEISIDGMCGVY